MATNTPAKITATVVWAVSVILVLAVLAIAGLISKPEGDCEWSSTAQAWVDSNRNGAWDEDEAPLAGVRFQIDDVRNNFQNVGNEAVSNEEGASNLHVWLPDCPEVQLIITALPPPGYHPTTPRQVETGEQNVFFFGFSYGE